MTNASDFKSYLGLARIPGSWIILGDQIIIGGLDDSPWGIPYGPPCCPQSRRRTVSSKPLLLQDYHRLWAFDAGETIGICSLKVCPLGLRLACPASEVNHSCLGRHKGSLLAHSSTHRYYWSAAGLFQVLEIRHYLAQSTSHLLSITHLRLGFPWRWGSYTIHFLLTVCASVELLRELLAYNYLAF